MDSRVFYNLFQFPVLAERGMWCICYNPCIHSQKSRRSLYYDYQNTGNDPAFTAGTFLDEDLEEDKFAGEKYENDVKQSKHTRKAHAYRLAGMGFAFEVQSSNSESF